MLSVCVCCKTEHVTGGSWKPSYSRPVFQPLGCVSSSSYCAGSHRVRAVLAAPQRGFCLNNTVWRNLIRNSFKAISETTEKHLQPDSFHHFHPSFYRNLSTSDKLTTKQTHTIFKRPLVFLFEQINAKRGLTSIPGWTKTNPQFSMKQNTAVKIRRTKLKKAERCYYIVNKLWL